MQVFLAEERPLMQFIVALDNTVEALWEEEDYVRARRYAELMEAGQVFPPIIVRGRIVDDGYHRLYAMRSLRYKTVLVVDLLRQPNPYDDWPD